MLLYPYFIPKILAGKNKHLFVYLEPTLAICAKKKLETLLRGNIVGDWESERPKDKLCHF